MYTLPVQACCEYSSQLSRSGFIRWAYFYSSGLLKSISTDELRDRFEGSSEIHQQFNLEDVHPFHGFKRDLIRLIGNMCYKQKPNQDNVRISNVFFDTFSMNTYVLLNTEHKNDVTIIVKLAARSSVKFHNDCHIIFIFKMYSK